MSSARILLVAYRNVRQRPHAHTRRATFHQNLHYYRTTGPPSFEAAQRGAIAPSVTTSYLIAHSRKMKITSQLVSLLVLASSSSAFMPQSPIAKSANANTDGVAATTSLFASLLSLELEKPLGILLEEVEEGQPMGVKVEELSDAGSAAASEYADKLVGLKVASVMGEDVTAISFDDVMDKIIDAPSPVQIAFEVEISADDSAGESDQVAEAAPAEPQFAVGETVTITVIQDGAETQIQGRVGDNLRKTLLDNKIEVYRGLKQKLGNCGGAGQCTFCACDFVESQGWSERSDYEDGRLAKSPNARLACLNNIQGPATINMG